ncbi:DUF4124 domain-containing protein [Psychrobacter sp. S1-30-MNA-CIBAN-0213]|uniref:DUF4124 domain-containing protein n=1 Tax=unclassified Psychrobacter TaxID=196806 RepID=UPI003319A4AF
MYTHSKNKMKKQDSSQFRNIKLTGLLAGVFIGTVSLYAPMINAAPIYKVVDEKTGHVTFTDRPQSYENQANKQVSQTDVVTNVTANNTANDNNVSNSLGAGSNGRAITSSQTTNSSAVSQQTASPATKSARVRYQLTMIEPSEARAYRRPAQSIDVKLQLKPVLQAGDQVIIYLDDNEVAQGLSASIATVDILPGTHSIRAVIKNEAGQTLSQIERTIYVIQNTVILQNKKKIAAQMLAYQRLPWHQKVMLKLRQKEINLQKAQNSQPITNDAFTNISRQ